MKKDTYSHNVEQKETLLAWKHTTNPESLESDSLYSVFPHKPYIITTTPEFSGSSHRCSACSTCVTLGPLASLYASQRTAWSQPARHACSSHSGSRSHRPTMETHPNDPMGPASLQLLTHPPPTSTPPPFQHPPATPPHPAAPPSPPPIFPPPPTQKPTITAARTLL